MALDKTESLSSSDEAELKPLSVFLQVIITGQGNTFTQKSQGMNLSFVYSVYKKEDCG